MRTSVYMILLYLILFTTIAAAQITVTAADFAALTAAGNHQTNYSNYNTTTVNIGYPGGGNNWNFSGIIPNDSAKQIYEEPSSTPYFSDFPSSNLVALSTSIQDPYTTELYVYGTLKAGSFSWNGQEGITSSDTSSLLTKLVYDSAWAVYYSEN